MQIIDDEGDLFGFVNVIDALVVLLVLAVVVAGGTLVFGGSDQPEPEPDLATTNVTLNLGTQPEYIIESLNEGDTYLPTDNTQLTVTDVHLTSQGSDTQVLARVRLQGEASGASVSYDGAPPRLGRELSISTDTYQVSGIVRDVGGSDAFTTNETTVQLRTTLHSSDAQSLNSGDSASVAGRTVATINDVAVYDGGDPNQRVAYLTATLQTLGGGTQTRFGNTVLRQGTTITLLTNDVVVNGRVQQIGSSLERETTQVILRDTVSADSAAAITQGDTYRVADREIATVTSVTAYDTNDPSRKRVYVGVNLTTLMHRESPQFGPTIVREGATVPFRTEEYELAGDVRHVGEPLRQATTRLLVSDTVNADTAVAIDEGDTYRVAGRDVGTVESVTAYGTNNPNRKRVYVGLNLTTLNDGALPTFGATGIREGVSIPFRTPEYDLSGTVQRVGAVEQRGQATDRTVTLQIRDVRPDLAQSIRVGATETTGGTTVARITNVNRTSSSVILTSQDGNIFEREHPVNQDITFEANLSVRETTTGTTFKGNTIQRGSEIVLDLGDVTIRATVVSL
jgi:hypothetical protein